MEKVLLLFFLLFYLSLSSSASSHNIKCSYEEKEEKEEKEKKKEKGKDDEDEGEDEESMEGEEEEIASDTLNYANLGSVIWDINDSLMKIPAYDLYCNWNNEIIHPYKFDLTKKKDTTFIFLQDENKCDYHHPVVGHITSNFGPRGGRYHYGIDIKLHTGDPVYNAFEGTVRIAKRSASYGNVVVVRHNNGLETLYAHLHKIKVEPGDAIQAGDMIGYGGNTGRSTGSHLHFEVRFKGEPINPNEIICFENNELKMDTLAVDRGLFEYLIKARAAKYHTIRRGDTLSAIAKRYRTSVSRLCKLNGIKSTTILRPGRRLRYT